MTRVPRVAIKILQRLERSKPCRHLVSTFRAYAQNIFQSFLSLALKTPQQIIEKLLETNILLGHDLLLNNQLEIKGSSGSEKQWIFWFR